MGLYLLVNYGDHGKFDNVWSIIDNLTGGGGPLDEKIDIW